MINMNTIGKYIKEERKRTGLTQEEFAMRSGLGLRFVRELEQGKETVRLDKVNQALAMFGMEAVPGRIEKKTTLRIAILAGMTLCMALTSIGCGGKGATEDKAVNETTSQEVDSNTYFTKLGFEADTEHVLGFLGADGFGKYATGGRGGQVLEVTNLNDSGEGSLRAAVEAEGARTVIFKVCGNIQLQSPLRIQNPNITIAGQTAPGDGICLTNYGIIVETENAIVRYLRVRPGDQGEEGDCVWVNKSNNILIDHLSTSWGTDETLSVSDSDNVSVQWCLISESLNRSINAKGSHGMGSLIRGSNGQKVTYHNNLYFSHRNRSPMNGNYTPHTEDTVGFHVEFINNVVYNWNANAAGKNHDEDSITKYNYISNYYRAGRKSQGNYMFSEECPYTEMYAEGNSMNDAVPKDQTTLFEFTEEKPIDTEKYFQTERFDFSQMENIVTAGAAFAQVMEGVGDSRFRDPIDIAVLEAVENGGGKIIDTPTQSVGYDESWGGYYPPLHQYMPYTDTDGDGMSDKWEEASGLDPKDEKDGAAVNASNYTNLEVFLEYLVQNPQEAYTTE